MRERYHPGRWERDTVISDDESGIKAVYFAPTLPSARTFPATITLYFCHRHGASCHLDWNVA